MVAQVLGIALLCHQNGAPQVKGFPFEASNTRSNSLRNLNAEKVQQLVAQVLWGRITHLMDKVSNREQRD